MANQTIKRTGKYLSVVISAVLLAGCAKLTHLTRDRQLAGGEKGPKAVFIDAKQRAVVSAPNPQANEPYFFCAEPSPDALSALAASQGLSLSKSDAQQLAQSLSLSEGAGSIGLRTQSIQLMRDTMYRLCEGYMSGALNKPAWQTLHRRLQSSMVAILAIEQITGAVRAPAIQIGGSAVTGSAELVATYTEKTEEARTKLREAESDLEEKEKLLIAANTAVTDKTAERDTAKKAYEDETDANKKAANKKTLDKKQNELDSLVTDQEDKQQKREDSNKSVQAAQDALAAYDKARIAATSGSGSASISVSHQPADNSQQLYASAATEISNNVVEIVQSTLSLNFSREVCATVFTTISWNEPVDENSIAFKCMLYMDETISYAKANNKIREAVARQINLGKTNSKGVIDGYYNLLRELNSEYNNFFSQGVPDFSSFKQNYAPAIPGE